MERPARRRLIARPPGACSALARSLTVGPLLALVLTTLQVVAQAESPSTYQVSAAPPVAAPYDDAARFDQLERRLQEIADENRRLAAELDEWKRRPFGYGSPADAANSEVIALPVAYDTDYDSDYDQFSQTTYPSGYDNGFVVVPYVPEESPFSLKINNQNTIRYASFSRDELTWTDSAGNVNPIFNSSNFSIPRGRLIFSGNALLSDLSYLLNIDYNSVSGNPLGFRAYALSYRFSRAVQVHAGQNKVPGTREWIASSWDAQEGPDRSMATTFFRPSLSQGVWFTGEPLDGFHYHAMLSNGFNTLNLSTRQLDNRMCFSESIWWEPWGEFGKGYSDIQAHETPVVRIGSSFTHTNEEGSQSSDYPENSSVRLSDGTLLTQAGALAPGVTLQAFSLSLAAIDLSFKYRGLSLSSEVYFQEISSLEASGPLPMSALRAQGVVAQGGYFVLPQRLELYSRNSFVTGRYGSGSELGGGFNWFPLEGKTNLRFTMDAAWLESSPADQNRTGFSAGQTGLLIRTQINTSF